MSIKKLTLCGMAELAAYEEKFGKWGSLPPNMKECDADEFWHYFGTYTPIYMEYRQVQKPRHCTLNLFVYSDGTGFALERQTKNAMGTEPKFYRFAVCEHEYEVTHRSNCYREMRCKKCGYETSIDSSG